MGKMQEALRKAEESRSRNMASTSGVSGQSAALPHQGGSGGSGTAMSFALQSAISSGEVDPHVVALTEPRGPLAEQYRTLRTNLLAVSPEQPLKVLVVTSAVPN